MYNEREEDEIRGNDEVSDDSDSSQTVSRSGSGPDALDLRPPWERARASVQLSDGRECIGRVGAPPHQEATHTQFSFWVPEDTLVEATQIVTARCDIAGRHMTFYALVDEVKRSSRKRNMGHEVDECDGDLTQQAQNPSEGITFATASILRTEPPYLTPPRERADVTLASDDEARVAYSADEVERPLAVGLIKNGGDRVAGPGYIDRDFLLGENGGHVNVNGAAGRGTKSSFLLSLIYLLLDLARREAEKWPSDGNRLRIVPIVLNVKGFDLFHIDRPSRHFDPALHAADWATLGVVDPGAFPDVTYLAPQQPGSHLPVPTGRTGGVAAYSWALRDVIAGGLLSDLFSDEDAANDNFAALVLDVENWLTEEVIASDGTVTRTLRGDRCNRNNEPIDTFGRLLAWVQAEGPLVLGGSHVTATWRKLGRRLTRVLYESRGVLRRNDQSGRPLDLVRADTCGPVVVDLSTLAGETGLQRFVVATILRQLIAARTGAQAVSGLKYLVMIDELNRFAPRNARDPITRLIETVAAEMRSQGILLFGAQQQASKVSDKVIENAGIRAIGKTSTLELANTVWRSLSDSAKRKADALPPDEKLILQDNFREPMHVRVPRPAWAMNPAEAAVVTGGDSDDDLSDLGDV